MFRTHTSGTPDVGTTRRVEAIRLRLPGDPSTAVTELVAALEAASVIVVVEPRAGDGEILEGGGDAAVDNRLSGRLWRVGVGPDLVLTADGAETDAAERVLRSQLDLRKSGAVPDIDRRDGWIIEISSGSGPTPRPADASILALTNGTIAAIGGVQPKSHTSTHLTLVAGTYGAGHDGLVRPLPGPAWTELDLERDGPIQWTLDLHTATLRGETGAGVETFRFVSATEPNVGALRASTTAASDALVPPLAPSTLAAELSWRSGSGEADGTWAETRSDRAAIHATAHERRFPPDEHTHLERLVHVQSHAIDEEAERASDALQNLSFDALLSEHRRAWATRWQSADIEIDGDPDSQLAVRFALFHLLGCIPSGPVATIGARGLTGLAYAGHVFWDTDVFVLPALSAVAPDAARAALEYRIRRLPAACERAASQGRPGARFPWESADTGEEATPPFFHDTEGHVIPIVTGQHAEHINSDIAWAVRQHVDWTGDRELLTGAGRPLVVETARYLASLVQLDDQGDGHLFGVIGPDEYHEIVDDDAYTNGMARWHLRQAAELLRTAGSVEEALELEGIAAGLVTGFDPTGRCHEQFAGYWGLEPQLIRDFAEPPVAADVLLGRDRIRRSQIVKQPDVLMWHHLLPDEAPTGSLEGDLDFYLPRTAHGSSLSPAICASLLARAGRPDEAMALFDLAARMDLDDLTGTTAGGLHLATMGGLWQAVVFGFAGVHVRDGVISIDPALPTRWRSLTVRVRVAGEPVTIRVTHRDVLAESERPVDVIIDGHRHRTPIERRLEHRRRHP